MKVQLLAALVSATLASSAFAADKHVHGAVDIQLAIEGDEVMLELRSPAANFIGFEYAPSTDSERKAVADLEIALNKSDGLFVFNDWQCEPKQIDIDMPFGDEHDHDEHDHDEHDHDEHDHDEHDHDEHDHDEHDHDEHDHDEHHHDEHDHDEHGHDEHDHDEHDHNEHGEESHADVSGTYQFMCFGDLSEGTITLSLFDTFENVESVDVQWIAEKGMGAVTLSPANKVIKL